MIMLDGAKGAGGMGGAPAGGQGFAGNGGNNGPDTSSQNFVEEELPTIQAGEDISVEDIPF